MEKMNLFILPFILSILKLARAPPPNPKILMELDISGYLPERVNALPSVEFVGGTTYQVRKNSRHSYIIDVVRDGLEILVGGDPSNTSRFVVVVIGDDGLKFVRVITNRLANIHGGYVKLVEEFIKMPGDPLYSPVVRRPIEVDLLSQGTTSIIHEQVVLAPPDANSKESASAMPQIPRVLHTRLTIQPRMTYSHVIGVVRFGRHVISEDIEGLISRVVVWEGGLESPRLILTSSFTFGETWIEIFEFDRLKREFILKSSKKKGIFCE